jgi:protease-4
MRHFPAAQSTCSRPVAHLTKEQIDTAGQGRVWAGQQAVASGLVDRLGGLREALLAAREAAHLPADAPIDEVPKKETSLLDVALGWAGIDAPSAAIGLPVPIKALLRAVAPLALDGLAGEGKALARMEWVPFEEVEGTDTDE